MVEGNKQLPEVERDRDKERMGETDEGAQPKDEGEEDEEEQEEGEEENAPFKPFVLPGG